MISRGGNRRSAQPLHVRPISIEDFLAIEDEDLKKYIFKSQSVSNRVDLRKVDKEDKIGYYKYTVSVKINNQGKFYKSSRLIEWIVYKKKEKKIKVSPENSRIFGYFLEDQFKYNKVVSYLVTRCTPTFCKRVIEGKIKTIRDIISYHKSYTLRLTKVGDDIIFKFLANKMTHMIHVFQDPSSIEDVKVACDAVPDELAFSRAFKVDNEDIGNENLKVKYNEWVREQDNKYVEFLRLRDEESGDTASKGDC